MHDCVAGLLALLVLLASSPASAQVHYPELAASLRASSRARGLVSEAHATSPEVDERWCAPPGGCAGDVDRIELHESGASRWVVVHQRTSDGFHAEISLSFWEAALPTFSFTFTRGEETITIGWETPSPPLPDGSYVGHTGDDAPTLGHDAWMAAELAAYVASPESFRDRALLRTAELRALVRAHIADYTTCDTPSAPGRFEEREGPSGAHGIFDTCVHRSLTSVERSEYLARLQAELGARDRLVRRHFRAWQPVLAAIFAH